MIQAEEALKLAYDAASMSPDPSSQNGAVVLQDSACGFTYPVALGCNRFPDGVTPELTDRALKLRRIQHAERDAIYSAVLAGGCVSGGSLVCPWSACVECAKTIIGSGIASLIVHEERLRLTPERWKEEIKFAFQLFREAEVQTFAFQGPVRGAPNIRVDGKLWSPEKLEFES